MTQAQISVAAVLEYLHSRSRWLRWRDSLTGRKYLPSSLSDRATPLFVAAYSYGGSQAARQMLVALQHDWIMIPQSCRDAYGEVLFKAPEIMLIQLRRSNSCGCLGHRHPVVREPPFTEPHDALGGVRVGEMDIAYKQVETWQVLPLSDTALDVRFTEGSRLDEFHRNQFRLKLLSIILHETHHLVSPQEPESAIRARSVAFYHDAIAAYVESDTASLSFTIDRSLYRFGS